MRPTRMHRAFALALTLGLVCGQLTASAAVGDGLVDRIAGQPDGRTNTPNTGGVSAGGLAQPRGAAFDSAGNLYVADTANNRVLCYVSPFTTDLVADLVVGQPGFNTNDSNNANPTASTLAGPNGLAVSATGDLWVADSGNHRVLQYDRPLATDTVADFVIGQPGFTTNGHDEENADAGSLFYPVDVEVDPKGNVWVADSFNLRVLEYDRPLETRDRLADRVVGQPSLTDHGYDPNVVDAKAFAPESITIDGHGNLWVADAPQHRVLEFDDPMRFDRVADRVLGQPDFTTRTPNSTGLIDAAGLNAPEAVTVDANDNVYVADTLNNRVLMYASPYVTGDRVADRVFGQIDFNSGLPNNGGVSAQTLYVPFGLSIDRTGNVVMVDSANNRAVLLQTPTPIVASVQVKVARATQKPKLVVRGVGMLLGGAIVEVDGQPLATTKYKDVTTDGTAGRLIASDAEFDARVPRGVQVLVTVYDPRTGSRSAPIPFIR